MIEYKYDLPNYLHETLRDKIDEINFLKAKAGEGVVCFAFITDFHLKANEKKTLHILERV